MLFAAAQNGRLDVLHNFVGGLDGKQPGQIVMDAAGNIFGSTFFGGGACSDKKGCGTIFEFNPSSRQFTTLYSFRNSTDGRYPMLGAVSSSGTLFGAASGGNFNHGSLFSLSPSGGSYTFTLLASLKSVTDADEPVNPPVLANNGVLIGATSTFMYGYRNGMVATLVKFGTSVPITSAFGQFLINKSVIYGTSNQGGITPCVFSSGQQDPGGCGTIFSYVLP